MSEPICWAYRDDGICCGQPAIGIDYQEGWPVCREHLDAYLKREEKR